MEDFDKMGRELNRAGIGRSSSSSVTDSIKKTGTQRTDSSKYMDFIDIAKIVVRQTRLENKMVFMG